MSNTPAPWTEPQTRSEAVIERLMGVMGQRRWSQQVIADALGIKQPAVSQRLKGIVKWDVDELDQIERNLGVRATYLFTGEGPIYITSGGQGPISLTPAPVDRMEGIEPPVGFEPTALCLQEANCEIIEFPAPLHAWAAAEEHDAVILPFPAIA